MQEETVNRLIDAASELVTKFGDSKNHTVGSAIATGSGKIITGLNLYHFTGGPCAEVVALSNALSEGEKDLLAIVAVGDRDRGVLSPCGRCRQILFEYCPKIQIVTREKDGHVLKTPSELLPYGFDWNEQQ